MPTPALKSTTGRTEDSSRVNFPRGGIALDKCARAHAWLDGRDYVAPDDVRAIAHGCLRHRVMLGYEARADGVTSDQVVSEVLKQVAVP